MMKDGAVVHSPKDGDVVSFLSFDGKHYLCAQHPDQPVVADRDDSQQWEKFTLEAVKGKKDTYALRAWTGNLLSAQPQAPPRRNFWESRKVRIWICTNDTEMSKYKGKYNVGKLSSIYHGTTSNNIGDYVVLVENLSQAVEKLKAAGCLRPGDQISFLEFAGHGNGVEIKRIVSNGEAKHLREQSKDWDELSLTEQQLMKAICTLKSHMADDAEIYIKCCNVGQNRQFLKDLAFLFNADVHAYTGEIYFVSHGGTWRVAKKGGDTEPTDE